MAEEEGDICRFCRGEGTQERPLFYPCLCTGSIKYIHQDCLEQWLAHSKKQYCELCSEYFAFRPVYAPGAPSRLPINELLLGMLQQCVGTVRYALRLSLVIVCWMVVMPFVSTCIWRLFFFPQELWPTNQRFSAIHIVKDCVQGWAIASSILLVFLAIMALNNYLFVNEDDEEPNQPEAVPGPQPDRPAQRQLPQRPRRVNARRLEAHQGAAGRAGTGASNHRRLAANQRSWQPPPFAHPSTTPGPSLDPVARVKRLPTLPYEMEGSRQHYLAMLPSLPRSMAERKARHFERRALLRLDSMGQLPVYAQGRLGPGAAAVVTLPNGSLEYDWLASHSHQLKIRRRSTTPKPIATPRWAQQRTSELRGAGLIPGLVDRAPGASQSSDRNTQSPQLTASRVASEQAVEESTSEEEAWIGRLGEAGTDDQREEQRDGGTEGEEERKKVEKIATEEEEKRSSQEEKVPEEMPEARNEREVRAGVGEEAKTNEIEKEEIGNDEGEGGADGEEEEGNAELMNTANQELISGSRPDQTQPPAQANREREAARDSVVQGEEARENAEAANGVNENPADNADGEEDREGGGREEGGRVEGGPADEENNAINLGLAALFDGPNEDVSFQELIGLTGPLVNLAENMFWVVLFISVFVVAFAFLPFVLGQLSTRFLQRCLKTLSVLLKPSQASLAGDMSTKVNFSAAVSLANDSFTFAGKPGLANITAVVTSAATSLANEMAVHVDNKTSWANKTAELNQTALLTGGAEEASSKMAAYLFMKPLMDVLIGYCLVAALSAAYLSLPPAMVQTNNFFARGLRQTLSFFCLFMKVCVLLLVELGAFPLLCGWWLDICTLPVVGGTLAQRTTHMAMAPVTMGFLHWLVGMLYMSHFAAFVGLLRKELQPGVLWFLRNPNDPAFQPVREMVVLPLGQHIRRILLSTIMYGLLIFLLVHLPVRLSVTLGFAPLQLHFRQPLATVPVDLLWFHIVLPLTLDAIPLRHLCQSALSAWLRAVGNLLDIRQYLLGPETTPPANQLNRQNAFPGPPGPAMPFEGHGNEAWLEEWREDADTVMDDGDQANPRLSQNLVTPGHADSSQSPTKQATFPLRVSLFLLLAWATLLFINTFILVVPGSLGRWLLGHVLGHPAHDLYTFAAGFYVLWSLFFAARIAQGAVRAPGILYYMLASGKRALRVAAKAAVLLVFGGLVIPLATGLLAELLFVTPLTVPANENAVFYLLQDWAVGCLLVKAGRRLVLGGPQTTYRTVLEEAQQAGLEAMALGPLIRQVVLPLIGHLVYALSAPYVLTRGILPVCGLTYYQCNVVFRYSYPLSGLLWALSWGHGYAVEWVKGVHDRVKDRKYLVRRQLLNHTIPQT